MDFFDQQERARRHTGKLVLLFSLAILGIIGSTYVIVAAASGYLLAPGDVIDVNRLWNPGLLSAVTGLTLLTVGCGTAYKVSALSGGGAVVAEALGGRPLDHNTATNHERRLLNVVEEMAIASGTPVPPVFLLEHEEGINAFAAGYEAGDAVIGVTRGCVETLSREELQGVIAHEFSHILNGDMRLNIRLMGLIHGILVLGIIGYFLLRSAGMSRSSQGERNSALPILAIGGGLMLIGGIGTFFGNMIKAAVSRQREFLADASAVQFTRNPDGLAGALKAIGRASHGSQIESPNAPEASHLFFGQGVSTLFATHPPLNSRILRLDPGWDGRFDTPAKAAKAPAKATENKLWGPYGMPKLHHVALAALLLEEMPGSVRTLLKDPYGARAVVYGIILHENHDIRDVQLQHLERSADPAVYRELLKAVPDIDSLQANKHLPVIDLAIPSLKQLSCEQYEVFADNLDVLVSADQRITLFEWVLQRIIRRHVGGYIHRAPTTRVKFHKLVQCKDACSVVLSHLAQVNLHPETAFAKAWKSLETSEPIFMRDCDFGALDKALTAIDSAAPNIKRRVLTACDLCVRSDGEIRLDEYELLRAIADSIGCPMPPMETTTLSPSPG